MSRDGAWDEWTRFFLEGVAEQARDALARAKHLQDLQSGWRADLTGKGVSGRLIRLVDSLFESPIVTIARAQEVMDVGYTAASNNIERLVELGILRELPTTYRRMFVAEQVLAAIEEPIRSRYH